jgi:hypothetical protein
MSIVHNKVQFDPKLKRRKFALVLLTGFEVVLTFALSSVLVVGKWLSPSSDAAVGVPNKLSYQGRLTDTSGNALGGSGTNYCFRFSLYDAALGGSKIWPASTPASSTLSVVSGVFNATIGQADTLNYDFYSTDTVYLNVEVNTSTSTCHAANFETMTPRQQVLATGFAITSQNVYGSLLKTDILASSVQIGSGAGGTNPKFLTLDVKNTAQNIGDSCSVNGQLWYNSNASNTQALVCENGQVVAVGNAPLQRMLVLPTNGVLQSAIAISAGSGGYQTMVPFRVEAEVSATRAAVMLSITGVTTTNTSVRSNQITVRLGIFSRGSGTSTASLYAAITASSTWSWSWASTTNSATLASITGWRRFSLPFATILNPGGNYWYGVQVSQAQSVTGSGAISQIAIGPYSSALVFAGNIGSTTNSSRQALLGMGIYSNTVTTSFVTSMPITDIKSTTAGWQAQPWLLLTSFDMN